MMGGSLAVFLMFVYVIQMDYCSAATGDINSAAPPVGQVSSTGATPLPGTTKDVDPCTNWERCPINKHPGLLSVLSGLPHCPCQYPISILTNDSIFDPLHRQAFSWRRVRRGFGRVRRCRDSRRRTHCIRQQITNASTSLAVQVCCYSGQNHQLVTRGGDAGSAYLVAPEHSINYLHEQLDLVPLLICGGDWTRYQALRPPNNGLNCSQFPGDVEYKCQVEQAKNF